MNTHFKKNILSVLLLLLLCSVAVLLLLANAEGVYAVCELLGFSEMEELSLQEAGDLPNLLLAISGRLWLLMQENPEQSFVYIVLLWLYFSHQQLRAKLNVKLLSSVYHLMQTRAEKSDSTIKQFKNYTAAESTAILPYL